MQTLIRTLVVCSISGLILAGCSINRADSLRMLDRRADYDLAGGPALPPDLREGGLEGFHNSPVPVRTRGQVAAVYAFPTEMSSTVYFWGAWFSLETEQPQWVLTRPGRLPPAPGVVDASKVKKKPGRFKKKPLVVPDPMPAPVNGPFVQ
jgi:hypothetical protein